MDIREIFENRIKIESKQFTIDNLFNNEDRVKNTNYRPYYQRNYVWDDEKATYFIESILLGTEIPPLIFFRDGEKVEVIDGRQRYETIMRYVNDHFKLKKNGLQKLDLPGIANRSFTTLDEDLRHLLWDTKIRTVEFSFHTPSLKDEEIAEAVKKEIFKRYNSGITPLKPTEIDKAAYIEDDLNSYFKEKLLSDKLLSGQVSSIFHFDKPNEEVILKKIRQLLVQHQIPIKYFATKKDSIISKYYELLATNLNNEDISKIFKSFITKVNILSRIKSHYKNDGRYNRLISEAFFWAFSILEEEGYSLAVVDKEIDSIVQYVNENIGDYTTVRSSFYKELNNRYSTTAKYFSDRFKISFDIYLNTNAAFLQQTKNITNKDTAPRTFEELRINKPEPSTTAIMDICRQMGRQRFLVRPAYQRNEVINQRKSSSIIESILLGIKLPPIFVYKRPDNISEVLDGQQRLLSILGFIGQPYLDENNEEKLSSKNNFKLQLKNQILHTLHGCTFNDLNAAQQSKIRNFDLWIIEINHKNNVDFEPIDLFIRLNSKPYPIKDDTFEMWNSYISRDIISAIKSAFDNEKDWFYIRKNNSKMENQNLYTTLAYFQYHWCKQGKPQNYKPEELGIYSVGNKISYRVKAKNDITKVLEDPSAKKQFIEAVNDLEFDFIRKLKVLISDGNDNNDNTTLLNKKLDEILKAEKGIRTQQSFYALWHFLFDISLEQILENKNSIRQDLRALFNEMAGTIPQNNNLISFKEKYSLAAYKQNYSRPLAFLSSIAELRNGLSIEGQLKVSHSELIPYLKKGSEFTNFLCLSSDITNVEVSESIQHFGFFEAKNKILLKRGIRPGERLRLAYSENSIVFTPDTIGILVQRPGFNPKYILAILYSSMSLTNLSLLLKKSNNDHNNLNLTELRDLKIPIISIEQQRSFEKVVNLMSATQENSPAYLFFERVLDGMVYELFFEEEFQNAQIQFRDFFSEFEIDTMGIREAGERITEDVYAILSDPSHKIAGSLLKLLRFADIQQFENRLL